MPSRNIIQGQRIKSATLERARQLRRQMTPAETLLWQHLRANRLAGYHFRRQQIIAGFIVDFYCHAAALAVELDGDIHDRQANYDFERDQVLSARGLQILRFTNDAVLKNLLSVLDRVLSVCRERAHVLPTSSGEETGEGSP
jgi:very-short-patch-repair endonuclease